ncbi:MAG: polysaccharide deacetylase family protein [Candidatus Omnitrophota bacterium]
MLWRRLTIIVLVIILILGGGVYLWFNKLMQEHYVVPILMYHSISPKIDERIKRLIVSPRSFERQMRFLKKYNYNVIPLESLAELIRDKKPIPPKTVAITFDDGYRDFYTYAFSALEKYGLPATMFIIVDEVGRPQGDRLGWQEILRMQGSGLITFGSHTMGPEPLIKIKSPAELKRQIFLSKKILEEKLGQPVRAFSYPEGMFNPFIRQMVIDAGYKLAVSTHPGRGYPDDDVFALKRLRISYSSDNLLVFWFETSGVYNFIRECDKDN